jgi:hypothetical protein
MAMRLDADVLYGSKAEVTALILDVCFTPDIRHSFDSSVLQLRANVRSEHGKSHHLKWGLGLLHAAFNSV